MKCFTLDSFGGYVDFFHATKECVLSYSKAYFVRRPLPPDLITVPTSNQVKVRSPLQKYHMEVLCHRGLSIRPLRNKLSLGGGVLCKHGGRVTELNLQGLDLVGTISPHLGNLSALRSLCLQNNHFVGNIPNQIGSLGRLRILNLSGNLLTGSIPSTITKYSLNHHKLHQPNDHGSVNKHYFWYNSFIHPPFAQTWSPENRSKPAGW